MSEDQAERTSVAVPRGLLDDLRQRQLDEAKRGPKPSLWQIIMRALAAMDAAGTTTPKGQA